MAKSDSTDPATPVKRKLIEVSLPLEQINAAARMDGARKAQHPWRLHYWWSRKPLSVARAILFAQLVDDPSSRPDEFGTEAEQTAERTRLHELIQELTAWENVHDRDLWASAQREVHKSTRNEPPSIFDPFAGSGSIPIEAQRLGLVTISSDLNPVSVLVNKALIEIPPKFADRPPVFPGLAESKVAGWTGTEGLAADVRAYGEWMRDEAEKRIGEHYPKAKLPNGSEAPVIAWMWARTTTCPNPACGVEMPLVSTWWLSKKKGQEAYVVPSIVVDQSHPSGKRVVYDIGHDLGRAPTSASDGTMHRQGGTCVACGSSVSRERLREDASSRGLGASMIGYVADQEGGRIYLAPDQTQESSSRSVDHPPDVLQERIPDAPSEVGTLLYGITKWSDLFTARQLNSLTVFSDLISQAKKKVINDAGLARNETPIARERNGLDVEPYADAVATYLALAISKSADYMSTATTWHCANQQVNPVFYRQKISMSWDFVEINYLGNRSGTWSSQLALVADSLGGVPAAGEVSVTQSAAQEMESDGYLISTDPPYYDSVGYSTLSDYFYVWLRRSLKDIYPDLFETVLVPKADELVANPYRHDGKEGAKRFFEEGFYEVFKRARENALDDFPITVYYAYKQSDSTKDGQASTGWETLLDGMIRAGWEITATWPLRTENQARIAANRKNALASSIVLALRPRAADAATTDRRGLLAALQDELPPALKKLEQGNIAPVDLPQAAIGPGMAVFSRYSKVIEADGSEMSVRSALARVNEILDQVLNEQEGDFDSTTRFAIAWYRQNGFGAGTFGDANNLANARNTSVDEMAKSGVLTSAAGKVGLIPSSDLPEDYDPSLDDSISTWEILVHMIKTLEDEGIASAARILDAANKRAEDAIEPELVKELAFLLFSLAEKNSWTEDALGFNKLATSWPDILAAIESGDSTPEVQGELEVDE